MLWFGSSHWIQILDILTKLSGLSLKTFPDPKNGRLFSIPPQFDSVPQINVKDSCRSIDSYIYCLRS